MLSRYGGLSLHRNRVVRLTYRPDFTSYGYGALNHHLTCVRAHLGIGCSRNTFGRGWCDGSE